MRSLRLVPLFLLLTVMLAGAAYAQDAPFGYGITQQVLAGEPVVLTFQSNVGLDLVEIHVARRQDKQSWDFSMRNMAPGESREFTWEQNAGTFAYKMDLSAVGADGGDYSGSTTFEVTAFAPLDVDVDPRRSSLTEGRLVFTTSRPASNVELEAFGENKKHQDSVAQKLSGQRELELTWKNGGEPTVYAKLKVYDSAETWSAVDLFRLEVPHEDVVFDSGEDSIRGDQEAKLEATLAYIQEAKATYDEVAMELYIAGYTDTVGNDGDNQKLSEKRARSIARWFRKKGLRIPVYYQGFGEQVLAVQTEQNVDEERNRRAIYLLSNAAPGLTSQFPKDKWSHVK